jgi:hypothetical protein
MFPPILLVFMFFDLIRWSSLFPKETGMMLIFLLVAPFAGLFFIFRGLLTRRFRIYRDHIVNPHIIGKRRIPHRNILHASIFYTSEQPWEVRLKLRKGTIPFNRDELVIGRFTKRQSDRMSDAFHEVGITVGIN